MRTSILVLFVGAQLAGCGGGPSADVDSNLVHPDATACPGAVVEGLDVSDGQGTIDWGAAHRSGIGFAYAKATQGTYNTQSTFAGNWSGMAHNGVIRGAYHFFDPTEDGVAQAQHFLAVVGTMVDTDLPPMLDVECPDGDGACLGWAGGSGAAPAATIRARMNAFLSTVQAATGKTPVIYTYSSYFSGNGIDTSGLGAYPLFLGNPTGGGGCSYVPPPWSTLAIWQYSWSGSVAGVPGQVDRDRFLGTLAELQAFASGHAGPPPAIPPPPTGCGAIESGHGLGPGVSARSCDGRFSLAMQTDGNLVLYSYDVPLWATGTNGVGGDVAVMQGDGNFVEYSHTSAPLFSSATNGNAGASLAVQDDGNVVVYANGRALWSTGTDGFAAKPTGCGAITVDHGLAAGESIASCDGRFMLVMQGDGNLVLYQSGAALWQAGTYGSGGQSLVMQPDGNLVVYAAHHRAVWSSRTNGHAGATLAIQDDGNVVIYANGRPLWATNTAGR